MQNPFASQSHYRVIYWLVWAIIGTVYAVLASLIWGVDYILAASDAFIFASLFSIMGIAVWNVVRFSGIDSANLLNTLVTHLVAGTILVFSAVAIGETLIPLFFNDNADYYKFSSDYHAYRLIIGGLLYILIAFNFYLIVYYEEYRSKKLRESELDKHLKSAELNMLKAQINPHFIFNSLNSVSSLTLTNPERAHEMVIQLADFLRYSIRKNADQLVPLEQEIEAIGLFLSIEKTRFGDRLQVDISCEDDELKKKELPALILQPVIENAIKYSLHETDIESTIKLTCQSSAIGLCIKVSNNYEAGDIVNKGEGIGLKNVKARLKLVYSRTDLVEISDEHGQFEVTLTFPKL